MEDIILKLNENKERLKKIIDKDNIKITDESNILSEYFDMINMLEAIKIFTRLKINPEEIEDEEIENLKKIIDKEALLEPIAPFISAHETLKETDGKYFYKGLVYKYINNKIEEEK